MDSYVEQLVPIKKSLYESILKVSILTAGVVLVLLCAFLFVNGIGGPFKSLFVLVAVGIGILSWRLATTYDYEYEYILTNGSIDIDKITAKRSRKRLLSFDCKNIERFGKYNSKAHANTQYSRRLICCNQGADSYFAVIRHEGSLILLVFEPNEKFLKQMAKFMPRSVMQDALGWN
ncbi:MAG TPA: hypothetical protein GXX17_06370 [Clostridiales bacterium]|nr:hypothetical protein [Clostridiales bacterium]